MSQFLDLNTIDVIVDDIREKLQRVQVTRVIGGIKSDEDIANEVEYIAYIAAIDALEDVGEKE